MGKRMGAAAVGAVIGGLGLYLLVTNLGGGLTWEDRLTLDQGGRLELEGITIFIGVAVGTVLGAPLGTLIALKLMRAERAAQTCAGTVMLTIPLALVAVQVVPATSQDPVVLPYVLFGGWGVAAALARAYVERWLLSTPRQTY